MKIMKMKRYFEMKGLDSWKRKEKTLLGFMKKSKGKENFFFFFAESFFFSWFNFLLLSPLAMGVDYLSPEALSNLKYYKYGASDKSLISKYIMKPYWDWAITLFPLWIAFFFFFFFFEINWLWLWNFFF